MARTKSTGSRKSRSVSSSSSPRGFFRLKIVEDTETGKITVGDTGWKENTITNVGFQFDIAYCLGGVS